MKKTYKYRLPKDAEVSQASVRVENGEVFVDVELKEKFEPKDGDFVVDDDGEVFILWKKGNTPFSHGAYVCIDDRSKELNTEVWNYSYGERYATEQEKNDFLKRLEKEYGKRWNPETKKLENIKWRAEKEQRYYCLNGLFEVAEMTDIRVEIDEKLYNAGNYFRTKEKARKVADKIKEMLREED